MTADINAELTRQALDRMRENIAAEKAANEQGLPGSLVNPLPPLDDAPERTPAQVKSGATIWDSWGMPVVVTDGWAWNPTACCGASAKGGEDGIYCRGCYRDASEYGGVPEMPFTAYPDHKRT